MEEKIKVPQGTKETLLNKAENVVENVKEKATDLLAKTKENELAGKAKEKFENVKEGAKGLVNKVTDKFTGKK